MLWKGSKKESGKTKKRIVLCSREESNLRFHGFPISTT